MKKITKLTDEQVAQLKPWAQKWIDISLSTEPADFDAATEAALKAYQLCNLKKPMVVLRMGSPYAATIGGVIAWMYLKEISKQADLKSQVGAQVLAQVGAQVRTQVGAQVLAQVWAQVADQVGDQVWAQVGDQVWDQVVDQVRTQVGAQVWAQVADQVRTQVVDQVGAQVRAQVGDQVWDQVGAQVRKGIYNDGISSLWPYSAAGLIYFRDVCQLDIRLTENLVVNESLIKSCGWTWWHENVLAISDRPRLINRDAENRLHCENGPSIAYRDGWALYHWHGVSIPQEWVEGKPPTAKEALTWQNIEQRRAAAEIVGWNKILSELNAKVINKDDDPEVGTLLEADIPDSGKERFLQVKCGTGRDFVLPVPPTVKTALEANLWTYGLDPDKSLLPEVRT